MGCAVSLLTAMMPESCPRLLRIPRLAVNRARQTARGREHKSDLPDTKMITSQLWLRGNWRTPDGGDPALVDLRMLVGRHRGRLAGRTPRQSRLRGTFTSYFPGLERGRDRGSAHQGLVDRIDQVDGPSPGRGHERPIGVVAQHFGHRRSIVCSLSGLRAVISYCPFKMLSSS